jgi:hypothetical protein
MEALVTIQPNKMNGEISGTQYDYARDFMLKPNFKPGESPMYSLEEYDAKISAMRYCEKIFSEKEKLVIESLQELSKMPTETGKFDYVEHVMKTIEEENKKSLETKMREFHECKIEFLDDRIARLKIWLAEKPDEATNSFIMEDLNKTQEQRALAILFPHY